MKNPRQHSLAVILPAFNEALCIEAELQKWLLIIDSIGHESFVLVVDDGSEDGTGQICKNLSAQKPRLKYFYQKNGGHGLALVTGYQKACEEPVDFVFQVDSDGQTRAEDFWALWEHRNEHDLVIGLRQPRLDGWRRGLLSRLLKLSIQQIASVNLPDANTPFRLYKKEPLKTWLRRLPKNSYITNVLLTIIAQKEGTAIKWVRIPFFPRKDGHSAISLRSLPRIAGRAFLDLRNYNRTSHT